MPDFLLALHLSYLVLMEKVRFPFPEGEVRGQPDPSHEQGVFEQRCERTHHERHEQVHMQLVSGAPQLPGNVKL